MTVLNTLTLARSVRSQVEKLSPAVDTDLVLPSAANMVGKVWTIVNGGTANILVKSSGGNLVRTVYPGTAGQVTPNIDSPTTAAHWEGIGIVLSDPTSYTPVWTATGTSVSLGNGSLTGKWWRNGAYMEGVIALASGTTTTYGTGSYRWSLPSGTAIDTSKLANSGFQEIIGTARSNTTVSWFNGTSHIVSATATATISAYSNGGTVTWGNGEPFAPSAATAGQVWYLSFKAPIVGWTATKG